MSWTQAICDDCWDERRGDRGPAPRKGLGEHETCCWCGKGTVSGLYVREDPKVVNYPS